MSGLLPLGGRRTAIIESPPVTPPQSSLFRGRLRTQGLNFVDAAGVIVPRIMSSGFPVPGMIAHGREADARAFLTFLKREGIWFVRMLSGWLGTGNVGDRFTPQEGLAALPRALEMCREIGIYAIPVALVDTGLLTTYDWPTHMAQVGRLCDIAEMPAQLLQEYPHTTQDDRALGWMQAYRPPSGVLYCEGSVHAAHDMDTSLAGGDFAATHVLRGVEQVARHRQVAAVFAPLGKPFVSMEPDRNMTPAQWLAVGTECRKLQMGLTYHSAMVRDGKIPTGAELDGLLAMVRGMNG